jgi:hypothetical protein
MNIENILNELAAAPIEFEKILQRFSQSQLNWKPQSWEGIPSETFSAIEQICHLRDIEIDGYQIRFQRMVDENHPFLASVDGYELAEKRQYDRQNPERVMKEFNQARHKTIELLKSFAQTDFTRTGVFEGYGEVTLMSLVYFLRSHDLQHLSGMNWLLGKIGIEK